MITIFVLMGGPDRVILDARGRRWLFEDHPHCGPVVIGKKGDPLENQPPENSPFWEAVDHWYSQGKRIKEPIAGKAWCVWDRPTMQKDLLTQPQRVQQFDKPDVHPTPLVAILPQPHNLAG